MNNTMSKPAEDALRKILALREITYETNTVTRRSQGDILQALSDDDLVAVSDELAKHKKEFGW